jgi:LPS sulfotransferase NodH
VVAASARSGSNLLRDAISATGSLGMPREWFNLTLMQAHYLQGATIRDCCTLVATDGMTANGVACAKVFAPHFEAVLQAIEFHSWFPRSCWVHLRRRNLLRQAISLVLAEQSGSWTSYKARTRPTSYSAAAIRKAAMRLARETTFWIGYFGQTGIVPLELWYEDMQANLDGTVRAIAQHIGVGLEAAPDSGQAALRRQATGENAEWEERFLSEPGSVELIACLDGQRAAAGVAQSPEAMFET